MIAQTWSEEQAARVQTGLLGTEVAYAADTWVRVKARIDAYASAWAETHQEVCAATSLRGEQSKEVMDFRMGCLEDRRRELRAMLRVLTDADSEVLERAVTMVAGLEPPPECATAQDEPAEALPSEPNLRGKVLAIRDHIDQITALLSAARFGSAVTIATEVTARARKLGHGPTLARALLVQAEAQIQDPRAYEAAERLLEETVLKAAERKDARLEAQAWVSLIWLKGRLQQKPAEGLAWRIPAEAALRQASRSSRIEVDLMSHVAGVLETQGRYAEALEFQREGVRIAADYYGPNDAQLANLHGNLGVMLARTEQFEEAERHLRRAVDLNAQLKGPEHPDVALHAQNLGNVLMERRHLQQARELFERSRAIRVEVYGQGHAKVAESLFALATVDREEGNLESAEHQLAAALESFVSAYGPDDLRVAFAHRELAAISEARGRWPEAEVRLRQALAVYEAKYDPTHFLRGQAQVALCRSLTRQGELEEAVRQCQLAVDGLGQLSTNRGDSAEAQFQLAEAMALQGRLSEAGDMYDRGVRSQREAGRPATDVEALQELVGELLARSAKP